MKVLITGGGGFLGSAVARMLADRGDDVTALGRNDYPALVQAGIKCVRADIRDAAAVAGACAGMDGVIHTAAIAAIWGRRRDFFEINVDGTRNVLEACRQQGVSRLVYTSSPSVVFGAEPLSGVDESQPYPSKFLALYPQTKAMAEQMVLAANGGSLATLALRPHLIFGPGDPHLIPRVIERARSGRLAIVGDGDNLVDITYIDNAASAHVLALDALAFPSRDREGAGEGGNEATRREEGNEATRQQGNSSHEGTEARRHEGEWRGGRGYTDPRAADLSLRERSESSLLQPSRSSAGKAYFISQGEPVRIWPWLNDLLAKVGAPQVSRRISYKTARRGGALMELSYCVLGLTSEPRMTRFLAAQLALDHYFDISAARRDLGYEPDVTTDEGVARLVECFLGDRPS